MPSTRRSVLARLAAALLTFGLALSPVTATAAEDTGPATPTLTAALSTKAAALGKPVRIRGVLTPAVAGQDLTLLRWSKKAWKPVDTATTRADGSYTITFRRPVTGFFRYRVVTAGSPDLSVTLPRLEIYREHTYTVQTDGEITADLATFTEEVAATYADPRGWTRAHRRFRQVESDGDFTVVLAEARLLPTYSSVCSVRYSCRAGRHVVINQDRWLHGSAPFHGTLTEYRQMVVNHETGHWLGSGHLYCAGTGAPAPVMQQQSKGMQGCVENSWPLAAEIATFN